MIEFKTGDIFQQKTSAIVNPVNCVGVMGSGLAAQFKERFPDYYKDYKRQCKENIFKPGCVIPFFDVSGITILSAATKNHWEDKSKLNIVRCCIANIKDMLSMCAIDSITIPALGCGLGGLDWENVKKKMIRLLPDRNRCHIIILKPVCRIGDELKIIER